MKLVRVFPILFLAAIPAWAQAPMPLTGKEVPSLLPYENALKPILQKWSIPGAAMAITDGGRLVYARGFGYADREAGIAVQPNSVFRLASISKTLTGMTVLKLAEEGKLNLDAKFMDLVPNLQQLASLPPDPRMRQVTVRQLLQHVGGFDRDIPVDWVLQYSAASRAAGNAAVSVDLLSRYAMSQQLDFNPGAKYSYSQSGYLILGRVIEKITGKKYEDAVREKILVPAGATSLQMGRSLLSQRAVDEVKYYDYPGSTLTTTPVVPGAVAPTPRQYGSWWLEMAESFGGWIGNAIDLMKYVNALEGRRGPAILSPASLATLIARPAPPASGGTAPFTGITWRITPISGGQHWWHSGGAVGTRNVLARRQNGKDWVVLMNSRPQDEDTIVTEIFDAMAAAELQVKSWPTNDLFADFSGPALATSADTLTFNYTIGSTPPEAQSLQVTATAGTLNYTVTQPPVAWFTVDKLAGTTGTTPALRVAVSPAGLEAGTYESALTISSSGSTTGPRTVRITLRVSAANAISTIRNSASLIATRSAAPDSRLIIEGDDLAGSLARADGVPTAGPWNGVTISITDSSQTERQAAIVEAGPKRVDLIVPSDTQPGDADLSITSYRGVLLRDKIQIVAVSPALFSANGDGVGTALATAVKTSDDGTAVALDTYLCGDQPGTCAPTPIDLGTETDVVDLQLAATGIRSQTDPSAFAARIGDVSVSVTTIQPSSTAGGVDLLTIRLPRELAGRGELDVTITVNDKISNAVKINIQ